MHHYRGDIDGLRAVAIVPVLLFHAGIKAFSGGFVGVDVFFVISGYLITRFILSDIKQSRFSLVRFYERRARRILPALAVVVVTTFIASYFILLPGDFKNFGQSVVATALFSSNILFSIETGGYFASDVKPLLHTWSLSVEEQFYIVWPLLLVLAVRLNWRIPIMILLVSAVSFAAAVWAAATHPVHAFYLAPFRAWELGLGGMLATDAISEIRSRLARELCATAALVMIFAPVFLYSAATAFPGLNALPPCLGTALLIHCGGSHPTLVNRVLSREPFIRIGLISYSLYLWHWPIIVLYRYLLEDFMTPGSIAAIIAVSTLLAWLSWLFVEQPFRQRRQGTWRIGSKVVFASSGVFLAATAIAGITVHVGNGWWWRLTPEAARLYRDAAVISWPDCLVGGNVGHYGNWQPCVLGSRGVVHTAIWGDSHALSMLPGIVSAANRAGERVLFYGHAGCPPTTGIERTDGSRPHFCNIYGHWALERIVRDRQVETVVLGSRLQAYVEHSNFGPREERLPEPTFVSTGKLAAPSQAELVLAAVGNTVSVLRAAGKRVVLVYPIPEIGRNVPHQLTRIAMNGQALDDFYLTIDQYLARTRRTNSFLDGIAEGPDLLRVKPSDKLCRADRCLVTKDGMSLYRDDNHLSPAGAAQIATLFAPVFARSGVR